MSHALRSNGRQAGVIAIWDRIVIVTSLHYCVVAPLHRCNVSAIASTVATAALLHRCTIVCCINASLHWSTFCAMSVIASTVA
jgi:hypothetical protein